MTAFLQSYSYYYVWKHSIIYWECLALQRSSWIWNCTCCLLGHVPLLRGVVLHCHIADLHLPSQCGCTKDNFLLFKASTCSAKGSGAPPCPPLGSWRWNIFKSLCNIGIEGVIFQEGTLLPLSNMVAIHLMAPTYHMWVTLWSNLRANKLHSFQMKLNLETKIKPPNAHRHLVSIEAEVTPWNENSMYIRSRFVGRATSGKSNPLNLEEWSLSSLLSVFRRKNKKHQMWPEKKKKKSKY